MIEPDLTVENLDVRMKVIGVGGGGGSVLCRLAEGRAPDIALIAIDTTAPRLMAEKEPPGIRNIQIGDSLTHGTGTGGKVEVGTRAAEAAESEIRQACQGAVLLFITSCFGGGAGTGAAPVIARLAKETGALVIGIVTMPFRFEGRRKAKTAEAALERMRAAVDALVVIRNDNLLRLGDKKLGLAEAFRLADEVLRQGIQLVSDLILLPGVVNVDFADLTTILRESERSDAVLGIGESDNGSAVDAVRRAVESPLLDRTLAGAHSAILNIVGDESLTLTAVEEAAEYVKQAAGTDLNLIFGSGCDPAMAGHIKAMLVVTGFGEEEELPPGKPEAPANPPSPENA